MLEASFLRIAGEIPPGDPPFNHPLGTNFATAERHLLPLTRSLGHQYGDT
jgi:hypothetical protein